MTSALWSYAVFSSIIVTFGEVFEPQNDWTNCSAICKCKWVYGRRNAECVNVGLTSIPANLSDELQTVNISENPLKILRSKAFISVGLINLQKIYLRDCEIITVEKDALKGLEILIELDLSNNKIHTLHPETFKENKRLRVLYFNKNAVKKLEDDLFKDMQFLQKVEMSGCNLSYIGTKAFNNVPNMTHLKLDGNNLSYIKLAVVEKLLKLRSLVLQNNPWRCDCHLRLFRDCIVERNLYSQPTTCAEPFHLQSRLWNEIPSDEFACKPKITWPSPGSIISTDKSEVTLSCQVTGNPSPEVHWVFNSRIIANNSRATYGDIRYSVKSRGNENKWVNLTITKVQPQDHGEFTCVAKNPGGVDERNITLVLKIEGKTYDSEINVQGSWPLTIGLITGFVALTMLFLIVCFCFCRKKQKNKKPKSTNISSSNIDISSEKNHLTEQEKRLLTIVNPIEKGQKTSGKNPSPVNEGTGLLELKKILNEDNSNLGSTSGGDGERSLESIPTVAQRPKEDNTFPPDLIAFPGRSATSPNPAISGNMTDSSRMHPHIASQSPINNTILYPFGTLPYSRSGSPFSTFTPVVLPRQGYVTIPRRPRVPSWSSAPTPTLIDDRLSTLKSEPVYDNLGPRTTADGSSVLSLNKEHLHSDALRKVSNMSPHHFHIDSRDNSVLTPDSILKRVASAEGTFNGDSYSNVTQKCKTAPKPPPKPNKNITHYEDETEDGTEV